MYFLLSFIFPVSQMIYWTIKFPKYFQDINILNINLNTFILVFLASVNSVYFLIYKLWK